VARSDARVWITFPVALGLALLFGLPLLAVLIVPTVVAARICTRPIDVSAVRDRVEDRLQAPERRTDASDTGMRFYAAPMLPAPDSAPSTAPDVGRVVDKLEDAVDRVLAKDRLRYWFHAVLGRGLEVAQCDPAASGVQWIEAAAHARSESQLQRAIRGLQRDTSRSPNKAVTDAILCAYAPRGATNAAQTQVMQAAGVHC
jgi:hypothetical protein